MHMYLYVCIFDFLLFYIKIHKNPEIIFATLSAMIPHAGLYFVESWLLNGLKLIIRFEQVRTIYRFGQ